MTTAMMVIGVVLMGIGLPQLSASAASVGVPVLLTATPDAGMTTLGTTFTQLLEWVTEMLGVVFSNPVLVIGLAIFVVGAVVALVYRMVRGG